MLLYRHLSEVLQELGFVENPYKTYVINKTVEGRIFTILYHVDDLKMSHLDPYEVTKMLKWTKKKYGNMNIIRGRKNYLLVMDVDYSSTGEGKYPW